MAERSKVEKSDWFPKKKNPCQANLQDARCISRNIKKSTFLQIFWKIVDSFWTVLNWREIISMLNQALSLKKWMQNI